MLNGSRILRIYFFKNFIYLRLKNFVFLPVSLSHELKCENFNKSSTTDILLSGTRSPIAFSSQTKRETREFYFALSRYCTNFRSSKIVTSRHDSFILQTNQYISIKILTSFIFFIPFGRFLPAFFSRDFFCNESEREKRE